MLLELEGFTIGVASCEREALERVPRAVPDVIVSDYHLRGGETGVGVVAAVRAQLRDDDPRGVPDGRHGEGRARRTRRSTTRVLLNKPVRADDLLAAVREALARRRLQLS